MPIIKAPKEEVGCSPEDCVPEAERRTGREGFLGRRCLSIYAYAYEPETGQKKTVD